jgi:hypothetical protein
MLPGGIQENLETGMPSAAGMPCISIHVFQRQFVRTAEKYGSLVNLKNFDLAAEVLLIPAYYNISPTLLT